MIHTKKPWNCVATFKTSFQPYQFHNKRFQMIFMDQLDRSKATCPFKITRSLGFCTLTYWQTITFMFLNWFFIHPLGSKELVKSSIIINIRVRLTVIQPRWLSTMSSQKMLRNTRVRLETKEDESSAEDSSLSNVR